MSNATLKEIVNIKVHEEALKYLIHKKKSKTMDAPYTNMKRQEYFEANNGGCIIIRKAIHISVQIKNAGIQMQHEERQSGL